MKDAWLDFLTQLHIWCVRDAALPVPSALEEALAQLNATAAYRAPTFDDAFSQWRQPLGHWWEGELPPQWAPTWRVLSRQMWTLTAEAMLYLEQCRPGTVAAALPPHAEAVCAFTADAAAVVAEASETAISPCHEMATT